MIKSASYPTFIFCEETQQVDGGRLQNNPSIRWVHLKSTHARPLAWDNNKRGIATAFRSQPRIGKIHDTVAVELLLLSAPAKMPLHQRTLLPLEYTSATGARGGSTCGVVQHRCGFCSVYHRLPVSSQANSSVFWLSLCLSPFPHSLFFLKKNPASTSPLRFPQKYLEERKKKIVGLSFLPMMEEFFVVLKLGFFWRGGQRRIGGFISTRFTTGTFASLLAVVPKVTIFVCRRSSFLV
jgi:hypothetical protein